MKSDALKVIISNIFINLTVSSGEITNRSSASILEIFYPVDSEEGRFRLFYLLLNFLLSMITIVLIQKRIDGYLECASYEIRSGRKRMGKTISKDVIKFGIMIAVCKIMTDIAISLSFEPQTIKKLPQVEIVFISCVFLWIITYMSLRLLRFSSTNALISIIALILLSFVFSLFAPAFSAFTYSGIDCSFLPFGARIVIGAALLITTYNRFLKVDFIFEGKGIK